MKIRKALTFVWLIGFINMIIAELVTYATPRLIQGILNTIGGPELSLKELLLLVLAIETSVAAFFLNGLLKGRINRLSNIIGAAITLLFIILLECVSREYLFFGDIETACMVALIGLCFFWKPDEEKVTA